MHIVEDVGNQTTFEIFPPGQRGQISESGERGNQLWGDETT
jgi:hypothetical protein